MHLSVRRSVPQLFHALVLGMTALVMSTVLGVPAYAGVVTSSSVLKTARAAIAKQSSAHVEFTASSTSSPITEKIVADVGSTSGRESVSEGTATLVIRVTPTAGYVSGSSSGLTTLFGLSAAQAKEVGTDWESWKSGTSQYANLKSDVTMPSVLALLPKAKGTKLSTEVTNGAKVYILEWTSAARRSIPKLSNTLRVSANGANLPVDETATDSNGVKVTTRLSKWGEPIVVHAPPAASTIASSKIAG